ncbi:MAG: uracil-DNA glycosylase family protein [Betaproteobacteria bacterium]|nr:uracil-DNA glycosylase family protein [Betaproteobacteria bacterium]
MTKLDTLITNIRQCTHCKAHLPHGPRPVVQLHAGARIVIAGQAPGRKVHESGVPFDDASGERLRDWLGVTREAFYDARHFAIVPMGFCYPGTAASGDLPPRPECAPKWRAPVLAQLRKVELTLVIGQYAMAYHLPQARGTLTETVAAWKNYWPAAMPLPHPSPRNNIWLKKNQWFEREVVPVLRKRVAELLDRRGRPVRNKP